MAKKIYKEIYVAIGHWKENSNTTCVACDSYTAKDFKHDLSRNAFVSWAVFTEEKLREIYRLNNQVDNTEAWEMIKKSTSNYRKWGEIEDYISQCWNIIEEKIEKAKQDA